MTSRKKVNTFHAKRIKGQIEKKREKIDELEKELSETKKRVAELEAENSRLQESLKQRRERLPTDHDPEEWD